ncbi:hypothetical protein DL89DRAFT_291239 [Linderina pennispora]|uniref:PUM-HD domain-containing protein n=1 Tax=Linderina pennispora TaxID=61395 RepID=A0A1Y1WER9_9FUNG|nr:uncharacterized protein DL89DRAFT_291239 [Linderina pennispora]ORX71983.1 hypothetical protein DL89DRAFT_291239 [Linderina pennispora]
MNGGLGEPAAAPAQVAAAHSSSSTATSSAAGTSQAQQPHVKHTSIFELGGEPFSESAGTSGSSSRLSRIVGSGNGTGALPSTTSPIGTHPLGTIGSPHNLYGAGDGGGPAKRQSQSRLNSNNGPGMLDTRPSMFDAIQSQQASPNGTTAQAGFGDFSFVKSLPVSRRNSREFQNLWQELEGFSINDSAPHPVDLASRLSGFDGSSIAARNSSGAFRNATGGPMALGASPKLPHGLLDDDMLATHSSSALKDSGARGSAPPLSNSALGNGNTVGSSSIDLTQPGMQQLAGGSTFGVGGRPNYSVGYPHDTSSHLPNLGNVTAALDSLGQQRSNKTDILLGEGGPSRDNRLYDANRGVNLIRNASTPVLNAKQYQVRQSVDELALLQGQTRNGAGYPNDITPGMAPGGYDMSGFGYGGRLQGSGLQLNQVVEAAAGYGVSGNSRMQGGYQYLVGASGMIGGVNGGRNPAFVGGTPSGTATPLMNGYNMQTPLGMGAAGAYAGAIGPQSAQSSVPQTPYPHHQMSSHIHLHPQQQQQQQQQQQPSQDRQPGQHHPTFMAKQHRKPESEVNRFANTTLEELKDNIFTVCKDQHGCRFLQKKLEDGQESHVRMIFEEVSPHFSGLMTDPFGKLPPQRTQIVTSVAPELYLSNQEQIDAIIEALRNSCLNRLSKKDNQFIYDSVAANCNEVGDASPRLLRSAAQKAQLVKEVIANALTLVQDPFGNYVVQYVLDLNNTEFSEPLIKKFIGHICGLSVQKFSSNVMEKCIRLASTSTRRALVAPILQRDKLDTLMRDSYGNYVVQTALDFADPQQRMEIIDAIRPLLPTIRHTPYGKRIYTKLQRDGFVSAVPSAAGSRHASPTLGPSIASHSAAAIASMPLYSPAAGHAPVNGGPMAAIGSAVSRGVSPIGNLGHHQSISQSRMYMPAGGIAPLDHPSNYHQPGMYGSGYKVGHPVDANVVHMYQPTGHIMSPPASGTPYERPPVTSPNSSSSVSVAINGPASKHKN